MQQALIQESTSARAGAYIFGSAARLVNAALGRLGLASSWKPGVYYGLDRVATVGTSELSICSVSGRRGTVVEVMKIDDRRNYQPLESTDVQVVALFAPDAGPTRTLRTLIVTSAVEGVEFDGKGFAVVVFDGNERSRQAVTIAGDERVHVVGAHVGVCDARRQFRVVALQVGSESLGNVKGSPWATYAARSSFLARWARRLVKVFLVVMALSWVSSILTASLHPPFAPTSLKPAQSAAAAGAATAAADAQVAQVVQSVAASAEAAASAGGNVDSVVARAWDQLPPEQQKVLLRVAAGDPATSPTGGATPGSIPVAHLEAQAAQLSEHERTLGDKDLASVMRAASLGVHPGKKGAPAVVVFEDPLCPSCRELAATSIPADIPVAVVPIAFQPGAAEWASKALCSGDAAKTWAGLMTGAAPSAKATCINGDATITRNNDLFKNLGFTATPTLVAPNGRVMVGAPDAATFAAWYQANLK